MKYIEAFKDGDRVCDVYLCKYKQSAMTKNGKPYENVILQDKTGTIDSKIWDPNSHGIDEFDAMDYVEVTGDIHNFQGTLQLSIKRIRVVGEGEYDPDEYLPVSKKDIGEMYEELTMYVESIENEYLHKLTKSFFIEDEDFIKRFKFHSAAKSVHHGFVGGLLEHTLSVVKMCEYFADTYEMINRDLLYAAAMFHDIGKLEEISPFPLNDYTDDGQLLGHIMIGAEQIGMRIREIPGFPAQLASELKHCILAHHGELEYGSPKKPALIEAVALSFADITDARMQTMIEAFDASGDKGAEWLGYNRFFESNIRKSSE